MKLGVSLPFALVCGKPTGAEQLSLMEEYGTVRDLLYGLRLKGVKSIELRTVRTGADPADVLNAVRACRATGLEVTIHGSLYDRETFLAPFRDLLAADLQECYTITVHTANIEKTAFMLQDLRHPNFRFALENNRRRLPPHQGMSTAGVLSIANAASPDQGLCWDWGHFYWNVSQAGVPDCMPTREFLSRVIHTHIHGVTHTTHFPPSDDNLPMRRYIRALEDAGYQGVYNLELDFPRFSSVMSPKEGLLSALTALKEAYRNA
ncbi:MAG: sugar phosphate isomerase/epimerase [Ruminococcaceae bacterium]|nr:sugar phosphate isomerase/epimerase [Oscillospiraceae bacterium]